MGRHGYDRVVRKHGSSKKKREPEPASDMVGTGISSMGSVSGGCDTLMLEKTPAKKPPKRSEAAARTQSKMGVLTTILAVIFSQFLICVAIAVIILLHHNRSVDW